MTSPDEDAPSRFEDAVLAAALFATDPHALGGVAVRAMPGPVRDEWLALLSEMLPKNTPFRRVPVTVTTGRLLGGLDLAATLEAGRPVAEAGLLGELDGGVAVVAMAERMQGETAALMAQALDRGVVVRAREGIEGETPARLGVVALDEGADPNEQPPTALMEKLGLLIDLEGIAIHELGVPAPKASEIRDARKRYRDVAVSDEMKTTLAKVSLGLGIMSMRPVLQTLTAARIHAALEERDTVEQEDIIQAARLVLAPRSTVIPEMPADDQEETPPSPDAESDDGETADEDGPTPEQIEQALEDIVLDVAQAAIPPNLLAKLKADALARARGGQQGKSGAEMSGYRRGRPAGVRPGDPKRGHRLSVIETLRAAAPWQRLRRSGDDDNRVRVRREDFRVTRFKGRRETATVFVVDASGSQALHRLAEVKGAVELLLNECYVRRDQVALIAFRNTKAEVILPPTRSLVRAKRALAGLPGGGGTPLASGIDTARLLADGIGRRRQTPVIVVMTDGRANVSRAGEGGRDAAEADAFDAAKLLAAEGRLTVVVDTSPRPQADARMLADEMRAIYLPLPHANAETLSDAVGAVATGR